MGDSIPKRLDVGTNNFSVQNRKELDGRIPFFQIALKNAEIAQPVTAQNKPATGMKRGVRKVVCSKTLVPNHELKPRSRS